jgi:hypothetical protein
LNKDENYSYIITTEIYDCVKPEIKECTPTLKKIMTYSNSEYIKDKQTKILIGHVSFNESFDKAQLKIDIGNNQEIHFWVKQI